MKLSDIEAYNDDFDFSPSDFDFPDDKIRIHDSHSPIFYFPCPRCKSMCSIDVGENRIIQHALKRERKFTCMECGLEDEDLETISEFEFVIDEIDPLKDFRFVERRL